MLSCNNNIKKMLSKNVRMTTHHMASCGKSVIFCGTSIVQSYLITPLDI